MVLKDLCPGSCAPGTHGVHYIFTGRCSCARLCIISFSFKTRLSLEMRDSKMLNHYMIYFKFSNKEKYILNCTSMNLEKVM